MYHPTPLPAARGSGSSSPTHVLSSGPPGTGSGSAVPQILPSPAPCSPIPAQPLSPRRSPEAGLLFQLLPRLHGGEGGARALRALLGLKRHAKTIPHIPSAASDPSAHGMPLPHLTLRKQKPLHGVPPLLSSQTPIHSLPSAHLLLPGGKGPPPPGQPFLSGPAPQPA